MPSRNVIKLFVPEAYYHIYARGSSKQLIFVDNIDFAYMQKLFVRYLSPKPQQDKNGVDYPHYFGRIELLAYCLMGNHFHLLLWQQESTDVSRFMKSLMTSYSRYFNLRHKRSGPLFESRYKASHITTDFYLQHISRYIHLNPRYWQRYPYSSLQYYYQKQSPEWIAPAKIANLFEGKSDYLDFLRDYKEHKEMLDKIKHELADH